MSKVPYANTVKCLIYLMIYTIPNLAHISNLVSRYMSKLMKAHWEALKWVFNYLKDIDNESLLFDGTFTSQKVMMYVDSNYTGDIDRKRSLTGYLLKFGGGLVSGQAELHHVVELSFTKAEYITASEAMKEALWLRGKTEELGFEQGFTCPRIHNSIIEQNMLMLSSISL